MWSVAVNILNKQLWTADKGGPLAWRFDEALTTPRSKNWPCYETDTSWSAQTLKL